MSPRNLAAVRSSFLRAPGETDKKMLDYVGDVFKGGSADVCQFGFVFHLPSVHVPAYAGPCHIPTKH